MHEYRLKWKTVENTWQENANENIAPALDDLIIWRGQQMELDRLATARQLAVAKAVSLLRDPSADDKESGAVAGREYKIAVFKDWRHYVVHMQHSRDYECAYEKESRSTSTNWRAMLQDMQTMWEQLYAQEQKGEPVYIARSRLLRSSQWSFKGLQDSSLPTSAPIVKSVADALEDKFDKLSAYAIRLDINGIDELPQEFVNTVDLNAVRTLLNALRSASDENGKAKCVANKVMLKFDTVFGDTEDQQQPIDTEKTKSDVAEMVRAVNRSGLEYVTTIKAVIKDRERYASDVDGLIRMFGQAGEALEKGERNNMPPVVAKFLNEWKDPHGVSPLTMAHEDESFMYPQMVLSVVPNSNLFDAWYRLLVEVLRIVSLSAQMQSA
eukprot:GHVS01055861.1.p1 GENE.GHVS01055861.1~~GHVS01055861.1.p1  ORF type:complete len:382 (+),score=35.95 GHVS01055861.1:141-1286(+)